MGEWCEELRESKSIAAGIFTRPAIVFKHSKAEQSGQPSAQSSLSNLAIQAPIPRPDQFAALGFGVGI